MTFRKGKLKRQMTRRETVVEQTWIVCCQRKRFGKKRLHEFLQANCAERRRNTLQSFRQVGTRGVGLIVKHVSPKWASVGEHRIAHCGLSPRYDRIDRIFQLFARLLRSCICRSPISLLFETRQSREERKPQHEGPTNEQFVRPRWDLASAYAFASSASQRSSSSLDFLMPATSSGLPPSYSMPT